MNLDSEFRQWKRTKEPSKRRLIEQSSYSKELSINPDKIFSSTTYEDPTETESFCLHLTESFVDETQESVDSEKQKQKQLKEVIVISDSSSCDESIYSSNNQPNKSPIKDENHGTKKYFNEESPKIPIQNSIVNRVGRIDSASKSQQTRKNIIVEESDSEAEPSKVTEYIKESIIESVTLSERKKKEILRWLYATVENSGCGSSCSQESAIANSRTSGISSGNSSLERLELNFETPNNRGKLSKPGTEKSNKIKNLQQNTIDRYFSTRKGALDIINDRTPGSKKSDKTPVNSAVKINPRKKLLTHDSFESKTPTNVKSDNIYKNIKSSEKKIIIPESESFESTDYVNVNRRKVVIPESQSIESNNFSDQNRISESFESNDYVNVNRRKVVIPESQSIESNNFSDQNRISESFELQDDRKDKVIISETDSFEVNDDTNITEDLPDDNRKNKTPITKVPQKSVIMPESLITSDDEDILNSPPVSKTNSKKEEEAKADAPLDTSINTTINDCADILENLYGISWRNKAKILISATEPKKQTTKKIFNDANSEKKTFRKTALNYDSDNSLSDKENGTRNQVKKISQTTSKKNKNRQRDSFINDQSFSDSSPDCSYYTALSVPNNQPKTTSTIKAKEKNTIDKILSICDSETDDDSKWQERRNNRKLSFDSSTTSSTSEFDPEDIVPPKTTKNIKVKKTVIFKAKEDQKRTQPSEKKSGTRSFLASLSKDVPAENADFMAMVFRSKYNSKKEDLCKHLYQLFNEKVFDNKLPSDMLIEWSVRLRGTAGKCYNKQSLKALGKTVRSSRIVLATKILDSPDRLRDTLIHELCHAATWLINGVTDGHGSFWKAWACKAMKVFPELPPISRCHNYEIQTKYTYKCVSCGYSVGRHSKSLDTTRKRCGYCHGTFELLINKVTKDGRVQTKSNAQTKGPSGFALFVKENYQAVKQSRATIKHGEVMKILGQQFSAVKLTPKPEERLRNNADESP